MNINHVYHRIYFIKRQKTANELTWFLWPNRVHHQGLRMLGWRWGRGGGKTILRRRVISTSGSLESLIRVRIDINWPQWRNLGSSVSVRSRRGIVLEGIVSEVRDVSIFRRLAPPPAYQHVLALVQLARVGDPAVSHVAHMRVRKARRHRRQGNQNERGRQAGCHGYAHVERLCVLRLTLT